MIISLDNWLVNSAIIDEKKLFTNDGSGIYHFRTEEEKFVYQIETNKLSIPKPSKSPREKLNCLFWILAIKKDIFLPK